MLWANSLGAKNCLPPGALCNFVGWHTRRVRYTTNNKHTHCIPYTHFHCSERDSCMGNFCSIAAGIELHSSLAFPAVSILYVCVNSFSSPLPFSLWFIVNFLSHVKFNSFFWLLAGTPWRFTGHCRRHWQEPPDAKDNASHDERNRKGLPFILKHCYSSCNLSHTLFLHF